MNCRYIYYRELPNFFKFQQLQIQIVNRLVPFTDGEDNEAADGEPEESTRGKKRKHEDDDEN